MPINPVLLSSIELLRGIEPEQGAKLSKAINLIEFEKGKLVVRKGDPPNHMCFLLSGQLQVIDWAEDGREVSLGLINPGSHFGELSILDGGLRSASIVAIAPSKVLFLSRQDTLQLIADSAVLNQRIMLRLVQMVRITSAKLTQLSNQSVQARVASTLLQMSRTLPGEDTAVIDSVPSQKELALMVSSTRESVSRCINQLARQGHLIRQDHRLVIKSLSAFRKFLN